MFSRERYARLIICDFRCGKDNERKRQRLFFIFKELLVSSSCFLVQLDFAEELPFAKTGHRLKPLLAASLDDVVLMRFNYEY